jgi:hypothetical protein
MNEKEKKGKKAFDQFACSVNWVSKEGKPAT